jgi:transcriptional regulator with XRE-family HTH domain
MTEYPNHLREAREAAGYSRDTLIGIAMAKVKSNPAKYSTISVSTVLKLELGNSRPRRRTAETLAAILGTTVAELFPCGCQDPTRNPLGRPKKTDNNSSS